MTKETTPVSGARERWTIGRKPAVIVAAAVTVGVNVDKFQEQFRPGHFANPRFARPQ